MHQADPTARSARARRDDELRVEIRRVWEANHQVYGPRKVWKELRRQGIAVARCTVARLMREMGLAGAVRGGAWITTTVPTTLVPRPPDLVEWAFVAAPCAIRTTIGGTAPSISSRPWRSRPGR